MAVVGAVMGIFAGTENAFFEFCTTKAYGWPAPWRIDYCPCEGDRTVFPLPSIMINIGVIIASGLAAFCITGVRP